jgi:ABC-type transporter Mla subunit MlaD
MRVELGRARKSAAITAIGAALALASAAVIVGHENVHLPWQSDYVVKIAVPDASGVVPGRDEVRWAGIVVGRITAASTGAGHAVLTAEMDPGKLGGARLYHDAILRLRPQTPLQDMYLDVISRGHQATGSLGSDDVLDVAQTRSAVDVADVLNTFSESIRNRLTELLGELATGLSPDGGSRLRFAFAQIAPMLEAQKRLSNTLAQRRTIVSGLIHDSRLLFDELSTRNSELAKLLQVGAGTLGTLGSQSPALRQTIAELPQTLAQMHSSFGQLQLTLGDVQPALTALQPVAKALPTGLTALRAFSLPATPALTALMPAIDALTPLARSLRPTSSALQLAFARLAPQAPRLDRITAKVIPCELPVDKFFAWTLSVLKFGNAANRTSSPRGVLVAPASTADPLVPDPTLAPVIGCADGKPAPR